jgi:hypothetical protein
MRQYNLNLNLNFSDLNWRLPQKKNTINLQKNTRLPPIGALSLATMKSIALFLAVCASASAKAPFVNLPEQRPDTALVNDKERLKVFSN